MVWLVSSSPGAAATFQVDAQAEVSAALYQANATMVASRKSTDARLQALRGRIDSLQARLRAGAAAEHAELARLQQQFVQELAQKDQAYAAVIATLRGAVTDIASTPEGAAALARYNAGNELEALAILDRMRAANEAARRQREAIDSAAEGRRIAELALDARNRGKLGTQAVIARLEEVTRLDPAVFADWDALWSLYIDAGRLADARHAAQMAAGVAGNDRDRSVALANLGGVSEMEGQAAEARRAYQGAVDALRRLAGQGSGNSAAEGALAVGLGKLGDASMQMRDFAGADRAYTDGLGLRVELMKQDPPRYMPGVMWAARQAGEARRERGDLAGADKAYAVALHIFRLLQPAAGDRADVLRNGAFVLFGVSQLRQAQNDLQAARQAAEEALQLRRQLAAVDPGNAEAQRFLAESLAGLGDVLCRQNRLADARVSWQEAQAILDRIIANSPDNTPARFDAIHIQSAMADVPGSGVRWKDVVAQYEALDARGMLTDYHRYDLDQARERAEASGRRAP